jgi:hypothetical protein
MWARNADNIAAIPRNGKGIYIMFDGSMPEYVGQGKIRSRLAQARRSKRRGQLWDRFSWYVIADPKMIHDIEVLVLRMLPRYFRALTRQGGNFQRAKRNREANETAEVISRIPGKIPAAGYGSEGRP